jgi:hypothetical protein
MQLKSIGIWQKALWKIVSNPTVEVVAAIAVVMFSTWMVIETETELRHQPSAFPVPFVPR